MDIDYNNAIFIQYVEYDEVSTPLMLGIPSEYAKKVRCIGEYKMIQNLNPPKKRTINVFIVVSKEEKYQKVIKDCVKKMIATLHRDYSYLPMYLIDLDGNISDARKMKFDK